MRRARGLTLAEVMMSMALLSVVLVLSLGVLHWALLGSQTQQSKTTAAFLAQRQMETLLAQEEPRPGTGVFATPHQGYRWTAKVQPLAQEPFLEMEVRVVGPRGASYSLHTQRCKERRTLVYRSQNKLVKTSEDLREDELLLDNLDHPGFSLSPEGGQTLAFVNTDAEGKPQIFTRPVHGPAAPTQLTRHPQGAQDPVFSPDGRFVAFSSHDENGYSQVFVYTLATHSYLNRSGGGHHDGLGCWMPDSRGLIVCRDSNSLVLLREGSQTVLAQSEEGWVAAPDVDQGKTVVFMSSRDGNPEIYSLTIGSTSWKRLTDNPGYDTQPHFSKDGKRILFSSRREDDVTRLYSMNPDGSAVTPLTPDQVAEEPHWAP